MAQWPHWPPPLHVRRSRLAADEETSGHIYATLVSLHALWDGTLDRCWINGVTSVHLPETQNTMEHIASPAYLAGAARGVAKPAQPFVSITRWTWKKQHKTSAKINFTVQVDGNFISGVVPPRWGAVDVLKGVGEGLLADRLPLFMSFHSNIPFVPPDKVQTKTPHSLKNALLVQRCLFWQ